jgi:hypothetical protein
MTTLKDIESAILQLPDEEIHQLSAWLQDYLDDSWDKQIKNDLESGKLDRLLQKVNNDITNNQVKPLDEILIHNWNHKSFEWITTYTRGRSQYSR